MKFDVYKLRFETPVHFGDIHEDYSVSMKSIHSDTMYSAMLASKVLNECLDSVKGDDLKCSISSLFPFCEVNGRTVFFFPKPLSETFDSITDSKLIKKLKKVRWVDQYYFEKMLNGKITQLDNNLDVQNEFLLQYTPKINGVEIDGFYDNFLNEDKEIEFTISQPVPRVNVSRIGEDATPYYMDRLTFKEGFGLYFFATPGSDLMSILDNLGEEGLGTDRNVGNGIFKCKNKDSLDIKVPDNCSHILSLSVFIPEQSDLINTMVSGDASFEFVRRGGWVTTFPHNSIRKDSVYAFVAGSVFNGVISDKTLPMIKGRIENLQNNMVSHYYTPAKLDNNF